MPVPNKLALNTLARAILCALALSATTAATAADDLEMAADSVADAAEDDAALDADLDALFDVGAPAGAAAAAGSGIKWSGYAEFAAAYTLPEPDRWSRLRARLELAGSGQLASRARWKLTARADADGAYDLEDQYYPDAVRRDQRTDFILREAYVDLGHGEWEFRLGRQQIIWGEMVGFFFADVVSARDLREFLLPEFESLRIGQWAARAEYFGGNSHFELVWIPKPSFDEIGKPGGDFYTFAALPANTVVTEHKPSDSLRNSNYGARISHLVDGWDLSAFYYRSYDVSPTLYEIVPSAVPGAMPAASLRHERLHQIGATFSKDLGSFVLKGEAVHTRGRGVNTLTPAAVPGGRELGLSETDMIDYAVGADIPVASDWRINTQLYGRWLDEHRIEMVSDRMETGVTFLAVHTFSSDLEMEFLAVSSLNRSDYMLRPKLLWKLAPAWRATAGFDIFGGGGEGRLSAYDRSDRAYVELRHWF